MNDMVMPMDRVMADLTISDWAVLSFIVIPLFLVTALAVADTVASQRIDEAHAARSRVLAVLAAGTAWMAATWTVAERGLLRDWNAMPPPFGVLVAIMVALACLIAFGPQGRRLAVGLPLWVLVAIQGFRLPLELAMHAMSERGVMPEQMTYSGWNFDIVTGATAIALALAIRIGRAPRWLVATWNVVGLALLANVMTIAMVSTPRFHAFGPDRLNVWVTYPPFVWLPAVMVLAALAGHLIIFRALRTFSSR